jgi:N-acetylglucosamine kinase-like BadF-type ATPase
MGLFLGVDGGQSSTTALVADETGSILGVGTAGPCNHVGASEGPAKLKRTILECLNAAGFDPAAFSFESSCFGMSGGPDDKEKLLTELVPSRRLLVTDDATIALAGALGGRPGVVTIAGTGSIALGQDASKRRARAGGWGYIFGDEGGAFDIVRQAVRAALRHEEGWGPATALTSALLAATGEPTANAMLHAMYTTAWPRSRVAALSSLVDACKDSVAQDILLGAGAKLASYALAVQRTLSTEDFSYIGGVFQSEIVLTEFTSRLPTKPTPPMMGPAAGALLLAYRASGISPNLDKLLTSKF